MSVLIGRRHMRYLVHRPAVACVIVMVAAGLAIGGYTSSTTSNAATCTAQHAAASQATSPGASPNPSLSPSWTLPGANLANTRDVPA